MRLDGGLVVQISRNGDISGTIGDLGIDQTDALSAGNIKSVGEVLVEGWKGPHRTQKIDDVLQRLDVEVANDRFRELDLGREEADLPADLLAVAVHLTRDVDHPAQGEDVGQPEGRMTLTLIEATMAPWMPSESTVTSGY
eukprot:EC835582.1.p1 GENE.EC835582.1~~EC835582.1.p1  ORF type:complete len:140 (+),score=14.77 EC835582.1:150-569(+)